MIDETVLVDSRAEQVLIGAVGHHADDLAPVLASLPGSAFYDWCRGEFWDALAGLAADREPLLPTSIARRLAAADTWRERHKRILDTEFTAHHTADAAAAAARIVRDLDGRRNLARVLNRVEKIVVENPSDVGEAVTLVQDELAGLVATETNSAGTLTWPQLLDEFDTAHAPGAMVRYQSSPWPELDELIGGLFGGRMYTVGGGTNSGKTALALQVAAHVAAGGGSVLAFSLEMSTLDVTGRLVARQTSIDLRRVNARRLTDADRVEVARFREHTAGHRLRVNSSADSIGQVARIARAAAKRAPLDLLVVDYLQLLTGERARSVEEEIAAISTTLKRLSVELDVPILIPAQLNRAPSARADQRPTKADLRSSGRIEQDSDVVILLWRPPDESGRPDQDYVTLIVDKNRHGPCGDVRLRWRGEFGRLG